MNWDLQSFRLNLRPCTEANIDQLLSHWTEPMVRYYLFDDRVINWEMVKQFVASSSASFQSHGYGLWALTNKVDSGFQGVCGLSDGTLEQPDFLCSIVTSYWGQGLATESAHCMLQYVFHRLKLQQIMATVDKPNIKSIRVLEKLGMTFLQEQQIDGKSILYYSLASEDYLALETSISVSK